jgi:hypothetical protein
VLLEKLILGVPRGLRASGMSAKLLVIVHIADPLARVLEHGEIGKASAEHT